VLAQQIAGSQLEILEVERRLAVLRGCVGGGEAVQELLEQLAILKRQLVERGLLDRLPCLLVARRTLASRPQAAQVEQPLRRLRRLRQRERLGGGGTRLVLRLGVLRETARGLRELRQARVEPGTLAELEHELAARRAKRLVDGREHPPQAGRAIRGKETEPLGIVAGAKLVQGRLEGLAADDATLAVVEDPEARIEAGGERMSLQQAETETVDGRDPGAVERPGEVVAADLVQARADAAPELTRRALGVGDHEQRLDVEPALADRLDEALHEHGRLPRPRARGDEDLPAGGDRRRLLVVRRPHARLIRHIRQRSHQAGQPSVPFGSCRTSPSRIRCARPRARSRAPST
jgi:hypothetical protein